MAEEESSNNIDEISARTAQHCAQCTAHGEISLLKGHKKICPFKDCTCVHCVLVNNKRQIMAKQVKLKRLQEKNHGLRKGRRSRVGKNRSTSIKAKEGEPVSPEKKFGKLFEVFYIFIVFIFLAAIFLYSVGSLKTRIRL
jgi:hypothetical protein